MELLLGVCHNGLRLVKLGLYDPNQVSVFVCSLGIYVYAARSLCHEACGLWGWAPVVPISICVYLKMCVCV